MSRHDFQNGKARVSIGWDALLASFFLQVWTGDEQEEDEPPAIWLGAFYGEVRTPGPLIAVARRHFPDLSVTLHRQLTIDRLAAPARPRRPGLIDHRGVSQHSRTRRYILRRSTKPSSSLGPFGQ